MNRKNLLVLASTMLIFLCEPVLATSWQGFIRKNVFSDWANKGSPRLLKKYSNPAQPDSFTSHTFEWFELGSEQHAPGCYESPQAAWDAMSKNRCKRFSASSGPKDWCRRAFMIVLPCEAEFKNITPAQFAEYSKEIESMKYHLTDSDSYAFTWDPKHHYKHVLMGFARVQELYEVMFRTKIQQQGKER